LGESTTGRGRAPRISLAYLPPGAAGRALLLERRLSLDPATLTRIAPAAERPGIHVGVWSDGESPYVWGATRTIPPFCFVLEVVDAGLLVIKHRRLNPADGAGKFGNVAVLRGAHPAELGGTRHLSAAQFVHEQHDSLALVASQDGAFTVFSWSDREAVVHAYRVESLLL
jgi:hypothetical protein